MNTKPAFDFTVDKEKNTILMSREYAAALPLVWDAYTRTEILDQWWAPKPWKARTKLMDFCIGGHWLFAVVNSEGQEHWGMLKYTEIQYQNKFICLDTFADQNGHVNTALPQAEWQICFKEKGPLTLVESQIVYPALDQLEAVMKMGLKESFAIAMEALDELLITLKNVT